MSERTLEIRNGVAFKATGFKEFGDDAGCEWFYFDVRLTDAQIDSFKGRLFDYPEGKACRCAYTGGDCCGAISLNGVWAARSKSKTILRQSGGRCL